MMAMLCVNWFPKETMVDVTEVAAEEEEEEDLETHSTKGLIRKICVCACTIMLCCVQQVC